jgi:hypothetical protein
VGGWVGGWGCWGALWCAGPFLSTFSNFLMVSIPNKIGSVQRDLALDIALLTGPLTDDGQKYVPMSA